MSADAGPAEPDASATSGQKESQEGAKSASSTEQPNQRPDATCVPDPKPQPSDEKSMELDESQKEEKKAPGPGVGRRNWRNNRRNRKRKVFRRQRPYPKPSRDWDGEHPDRANLSLNLDQEQERRENFVKMSMQKYGKPFAPYNTTQFLMEDHNVREPEFEEISRLLRQHQDQEDQQPSSKPNAENESFSTRDGSDSDDFYSSPDDERDFQQRQFSEVYEHVHAERLSAMTKNQLVQEYVLLEQKAEDLEQKLKASQAQLADVSRTAAAGPVAGTSSSDLMRLKAEVKRLMQENDRLKCMAQLQRPHSSTSSMSSSSSAASADSCTHALDANAIPSSTSSAVS